MTSPPPAYQIEIDNDSQDQLLTDLPCVAALPLWKQMSVLVPARPKPKAVPHKWSYEELRPHLIRAGQLVPEHEAERRVLMLINPAMTAPSTTDTLYAGLQLVLPGETAPAHRHTAFAVRFIVEGSGGFTAIDGKRIKMARGDFILTPAWKYHDHGNDGVADPMIWLDGLDLPQYQHFPVHFAQHYSQPRYPAKDATSSELHFPWRDMERELMALPGPHRIVRYTSKEQGKEKQDVSVRLGAQCEHLQAGAMSSSARENASAVYHIIDGEGQTSIGEVTIKWTKGDTFAIPAWQPYSHQATTSTFLFRFDDIPMLKALNYYRNENEGFLDA